MSRCILSRSPRYAVLFIIFACFSPRMANAGKEILSVQCGSPQMYDSQTNTYIVPVTVTLENGAPDTIDMSYSAQDNANPPNQAACSPASDKLSVSKGNPVVDNVMVTYSGSGAITFTAYGNGENGGDSDSSQILLSFPAPAALTAQVNYGNISTLSKYAVPLTVTLQQAGSPDTLHMTYGASNASGMLQRSPASEDVVVQAGMPITHRVFVDYPSAQPAVTFGVLANGAMNSISFQQALPLAATQTSTNGNVSLALGPSSSFSKLLAPVTITVPVPAGADPIPAKVRFWALDSNGTEYACRPRQMKLQFNPSSTTSNFNVNVDTNGAPHVTLYCRGVGLDPRFLSVFRYNALIAQ